MLHAFLQKGIRRVLVTGKPEPARQGNEDAVTSMVFGPLCFMSTPDAVLCLSAAFGSKFRAFLDDRVPVGHDVQLWPSGLKAQVGDEAATRCEPDLLVILDFEKGARAAVVCEMKWDAPDGAETMALQIRREREAVAAGKGIPPWHQFTVSVTTNRLAHLPTGVDHAVTWSSLEGDLAFGARQGDARSPSRIWCELCSKFLRKSKRSTFEGFSDLPDLSAIDQAPSVFFREAT